MDVTSYKIAHPYTVMRQPNEGIPVFEVQRENVKGNVRTLHRNLLPPIGSLCDDEQLQLIKLSNKEQSQVPTVASKRKAPNKQTVDETSKPKSNPPIHPQGNSDDEDNFSVLFVSGVPNDIVTNVEDFGGTHLMTSVESVGTPTS